MRTYKQNDIKDTSDWMAMILLMGAMALICFSSTGCSMRMEVGYHGQTGRDDRVQTQLVRDSSNNQKKY
jgi:hypothetical protein